MASQGGIPSRPRKAISGISDAWAAYATRIRPYDVVCAALPRVQHVVHRRSPETRRRPRGSGSRPSPV
ncbi:hypothetical protein TRAPUB_2019 [Trametes pubescens]|uniref:Uncharacterized protein n=1 Tax=Trametes pubescens TaxID=154538 RepID=A0A1M2VHT1_TRAPU|nr:hypothetical protein TRAPUB_2019 [Trametes pubescens]